MNILIVIDKNYLCYLQCLLESWKRNYTQGCFQWIIYFIQPYDQPEDRKTLQILYDQCDIFTKIWKDRYGSNKNNKVVALDRDPGSLIEAKKLLKKFKGRFRFENEKFSNINQLKISDHNLKAIIFDLGYSTSQINDLKKGLSFNSKGKLNMKLGKNFFSADDVINKMSYENLNKVFKFFGDEQKSKIIARNIIKKRLKKKILSEDLVHIIESVKKKIFKNK